MLSDMRAVNWNSIREMSNVSDMWSSFKSNFMSVVDKHLPFKERRIKMNSEQWINDQILSEMRHRDYLHNKALKTKSEYDWKLYTSARNRVVAIIKDAKQNFVEEAISQAENNQKTCGHV